MISYPGSAPAKVSSLKRRFCFAVWLILGLLLAASAPGWARDPRDTHTTSDGAHKGQIFLKRGNGDALDRSGRIGEIQLSYALWTVAGEPAEDYKMRWQRWDGPVRDEFKLVGTYKGTAVTIRSLAKYPDLKKRFEQCAPTDIQFHGTLYFDPTAMSDYPGAPGSATITFKPDVVEAAGKPQDFSAPGSRDWADFFTLNSLALYLSGWDAVMPERAYHAKVNKETFTKAKRVILTDLEIVKVEWNEAEFSNIAEEYLQREKQEKEKQAQALKKPNPFEQPASPAVAKANPFTAKTNNPFETKAAENPLEQQQRLERERLEQERQEQERLAQVAREQAKLEQERLAQVAREQATLEEERVAQAAREAEERERQERVAMADAEREQEERDAGRRAEAAQRPRSTERTAATKSKNTSKPLTLQADSKQSAKASELEFYADGQRQVIRYGEDTGLTLADAIKEKDRIVNRGRNEDLLKEFRRQVADLNSQYREASDRARRAYAELSAARQAEIQARRTPYSESAAAEVRAEERQREEAHRREIQEIDRNYRDSMERLKANYENLKR